MELVTSLGVFGDRHGPVLGEDTINTSRMADLEVNDIFVELGDVIFANFKVGGVIFWSLDLDSASWLDFEEWTPGVEFNVLVACGGRLKVE